MIEVAAASVGGRGAEGGEIDTSEDERGVKLN